MSKSDLWCTPPDLFTRLNEEFHFDLDAAASDSDHLCEHYITVEQDALVTPWHGKVIYCNPPYSMLPEFVNRAANQSVEQESKVVILIPAYTDTRYWADTIVQHASEIRFLVGRLRFWENGKPGKDTARFSSAIAVFDGTRRGFYTSGPNVSWWDWKIK